MKVINISFKEYVELQDRGQYDFYLRYGNIEPVDYFEIGDYINETFGFVKDMQDYLNSTGLTWEAFIKEMAKKTGKTPEEVAKEPLFFLQQARLHAKAQIEFINEIENKAMSYAPSAAEESADLSVFEKYRAFIQLDKLAGGDVTKIEHIKALPYLVCFTKLSLEADSAEYQRRLSKFKKT